VQRNVQEEGTARARGARALLTLKQLILKSHLDLLDFGEIRVTFSSIVVVVRVYHPVSTCFENLIFIVGV